MAVAVLADGLAKRFGAVEALRGLSFAARKGELVVLAGPNGAGKTTVVRIMTTNLKPDGGRAEVLGFDVVREYGEVRKRIY
jgi:ABC-type multidrug transport system ATPase subunit